MYKSDFTGYPYAIRYLSMFFLACFFIMLLSGCMSGSKNDGSQNRAQGPATLKIVLGDNRVNKALNTTELPDGIDSVVVKITDSSGSTLGEGDILASGGELTLSVPSGVLLTIKGLAFAGDSLNFQAQTNVGPFIAGISTSVALTLVPAGANASELNAPIQIDISPDGRSGNALSNQAMFSDDNQIILFKSEATNLITGDTNNQTDFFLKDRGNNRITNVHTNSENEQADGAAVSADMSADGRIIIFESEARNFASNPVDTNAAADIFIKELDTNTTTRISVTSTNQEAPLPSSQPSLSEDGQIAVFVSDNTLTDTGATGVYLKQLSNGDLEYLGAGQAPLLSGDGSQVVIWDAIEQRLKLYNVEDKTSSDLVAPYVVPKASESTPYDISTNGLFVVFALQGGNAAEDGTESSSGIYLYENVSDDTVPAIRLISTDSDGIASDTTFSPAITPSLSGEGRYIVYTIGTTIHVKDSTTEEAIQLAQAGAFPSLSKDGQWIAYTISDTDNLYIVSNPLFSSTPSSSDTPTTQTLTVTTEGGGRVNSQDGNIACGEQCSFDYASASLVQLTAVADTGFVLSDWQGDCTGSNLIVQVTLDQARSCTAVFTPENKTLMLTIKGGPNAGSVRSDDGDENTVPTLVCENKDGEETLCNGEFPHGQNVTLIPTLGEGKNAVVWTGCENDNAGLDGCTVTLTESKNVTANFALIAHTLTINKAGEGQGVVTSENAAIDCGDTCSAAFTEGDNVVLIANAAQTSVFTEWQGACSGTSSRIELTLTEAANCTASFALADFSLSVSSTGSSSSTITSSDNGINCGNDCSEIYTSGTTVTLTANAVNDDVFVAWSGSEQCTGTDPSVEVTVEGNVSCVAGFLVRHELTVSKIGVGTVTSNPGEINCGDDCSETYDRNTEVTLIAVAGSGFVFTNWGGNCSGTNSSASVTLNTAKNCTANFEAEVERFSLTVSKVGTGTVTSSPGGINCGGDCEETYDKDTRVTLTAAAGSGFVFTGWSGDCSGTNSSASVTLNTAKNCTVNFEAEVERFTLSIEKAGAGNGLVASTDDGISCGTSCKQQYGAGSLVGFFIRPDLGSEFQGWSGSTCKINGNNELEVNAETTCIATFALLHNITEISFSPSSPRVIAAGRPVNISFNYQTSENVRIWAHPFTKGALTPSYSISGVRPYLAGTGSGTQFFRIRDAGTDVDQVRFQIRRDNTQAELLYEIFVDVNYTFVPLGSAPG